VPYITKEQRVKLDDWLVRLSEPELLQPGELNYLITRLLLRTKPQRYHDYNALIGVLETVKLEFYRRRVVPYEDYMCHKNGEVY